MKCYTTAQARKRFAKLLDAAERGQPVMIERRGVRFLVQTQQHRTRRPMRRKSIIEHLDPAVASGQWTWAWNSRGIRFTARRGPR